MGEHYGIEFWLPNDGGNCDGGLLICYPALLQLGNHSDTVTNFKAKRAFTIDDKKDDIAKECGERMAKDGHENGKIRWHGIKLRTVPMRTDNGTVSHFFIRLEATIASKPL
ncbi:hypothetical protein niasHT_036157 [Heterodera trifolii]|uniref:Uncharacterized protein n=1 Tax=Heterodera trifolii TaxID=157864 RepID=A0ABD2IG54_9BILA